MIKDADPSDLSKKRVTEELSKNRFGICLTCPELKKLTTQCRISRGLMKTKTTLEEASCPIKKW